MSISKTWWRHIRALVCIPASVIVGFFLGVMVLRTINALQAAGSFLGYYSVVLEYGAPTLLIAIAHVSLIVLAFEKPSASKTAPP